MKDDGKFSWWCFARQNYVETMMVGYLLYEYLTFYRVFEQLSNFKSIFMVMNVELNTPLQLIMSLTDFTLGNLTLIILLSTAVSLAALWHGALFYRRKLTGPDKDYWQAYGIVPLIGIYLLLWLSKWLLSIGPMWKVQELINKVH